MHTNNMIQFNHENTHAFGSATLMSRLLIKFLIDNQHKRHKMK